MIQKMTHQFSVASLLLIHILFGGASSFEMQKPYNLFRRVDMRAFARTSRGLTSQQDGVVISSDHQCDPDIEAFMKSCYESEVVGSTGRFGSFLVRQITNYGETTKDNVVYRVPRHSDGLHDIRIGEHSLPNSPIYVATPANAIPDILSRTIPHRQQDLVFVCNGLVAKTINEAQLEQKTKGGLRNSFILEHTDVTMVVPHFGVLEVDADPVGRKVPSVVYGRHASVVAKLFGTASLPVSVVSSSEEVTGAAALKLLWASFMWLLIQDELEGTALEQCTVSQVHDNPALQNTLHDLVKEMLPIVKLLSVSPRGGKHLFTSNVTLNELSAISEVREILAYLEEYSRSLPDAKPSFDLGVKEFMARNGQFLLLEHIAPQPCHRALLRRVLGDDLYNQKMLELAAEADRVHVLHQKKEKRAEWK